MMTDSQASSSFDLLDPKIKRWIWESGWTELRAVQEMAIPAIAASHSDVIIAAATAAGKTEAAFLPILSRMMKDGSCTGLTIYISPLKALINDQFGRLERLCADLDIPVYPWHGDISVALKAKFIKAPTGILLITPESLEALFCNRGSDLSRIFENLQFIAIDELHAFIGTERGKQLQSLLQRVQHIDGIVAPRIGLSATLGDMQLAKVFLRPADPNRVLLVEAPSEDSVLKILIKGYIDDAVEIGQEGDCGGKDGPSMAMLAEDIYRATRDSNNLVFPNSRGDVERLAFRLRKICEEAGIPNQYWPHHGSLSKDLREEVEQMLKDGSRPVTAICTNTLELGVDIGQVKSVVQVNSPHSVASLRQRMGRSGRRVGEPTILRGAVIEQRLLPGSHILDQLRESTVQFAAVVDLMLSGWFEPPKPHGLHLSTLVQQLLSLVTQRSGVNPAVAFRALCSHGAFQNVEREDFVELLRHLKIIGVIEQEESGLILIGKSAEAAVNNFRFYAAFAASEEFRLVEASRVLGSIPVDSALMVGDLLIFAGKTWKVESIEDSSKTITVSSHRASKPPAFSSAGRKIHRRVREQMRNLLRSDTEVAVLDSTAKQLLAEARDSYRRHDLDTRCLVKQGSSYALFAWLGDDAQDVLEFVFKGAGFECKNLGLCLDISGAGLTEDLIAEVVRRFAEGPVPSAEALLADAQALQVEKWDWTLPRRLLIKSYASSRLDILAAHTWAREAIGLDGTSPARPPSDFYKLEKRRLESRKND